MGKTRLKVNFTNQNLSLVLGESITAHSLATERGRNVSGLKKKSMECTVPCSSAPLAARHWGKCFVFAFILLTYISCSQESS